MNHLLTQNIDDAEERGSRSIRHRSKSVGSAQIDSWRTTRENENDKTVIIRRPSSLSLNDMDNLEARTYMLGEQNKKLDKNSEIRIRSKRRSNHSNGYRQDISFMCYDIPGTLQGYSAGYRIGRKCQYPWDVHNTSSDIL